MADIAYNFGMSLCSDDKLLLLILAVIFIADTILCIALFILSGHDGACVVLWILLFTICNTFILVNIILFLKIEEGSMSRQNFDFCANCLYIVAIAISAIVIPFLILVFRHLADSLMIERESNKRKCG